MRRAVLVVAIFVQYSLDRNYLKEVIIVHLFQAIIAERYVHQPFRLQNKVQQENYHPFQVKTADDDICTISSNISNFSMFVCKS